MYGNGTSPHVQSVRILPQNPRHHSTMVRDPWMPQREQALWEHFYPSATFSASHVDFPVAEPPAPEAAPRESTLELNTSFSQLALPEHLLDSDSESACSPTIKSSHTSPRAKNRQRAQPFTTQHSHHPIAPRPTIVGLPPLPPIGNSILSHDAKPFMPHTHTSMHKTMLISAIYSSKDLHQAVCHATSPSALYSLITKHEPLIDGTCVVAGMQRLQMLDPQLAPPSEFQVRVQGSTCVSVHVMWRQFPPHPIYNYPGCTSSGTTFSN